MESLIAPLATQLERERGRVDRAERQLAFGGGCVARVVQLIFVVVVRIIDDVKAGITFTADRLVKPTEGCLSDHLSVVGISYPPHYIDMAALG